MQPIRIIKSIGLIGSVALSLLLCTAQSFEPAPKLYRAKPEDVPPWAEQGKFRFIRIDGGQIESWKAQRTWWGNKFSAEEKDVLTHIYDRDSSKSSACSSRRSSTASGSPVAAAGPLRTRKRTGRT
jgi:hypothetical protein